MDVPTLKLDQRTLLGKKVRRLRRQGVIPVHVYGAGIDPANLQVDDRTLNRLLLQVGSNIPVSVEYEGQNEESICFVREIQRHPVNDSVIHVDFLRVDITQTIAAEVPVTLIGSSPAVSSDGRDASPKHTVAYNRSASNEHAGRNYGGHFRSG